MKGSQLSVGALQIWSEMPRLELKGERIILDNATVDQFSYYSYIDRWGEKYGQRSHKTLAGFKTTLINASESVTLINDSTIYTSNGDVEIKAKNINVNNSEVVSHNVWPSHNWNSTGWEGGKRTIRLDARDQMSLVDSRITGNSLSDIGRMQIELEGYSLHSSNSSVTILDETKGHTGLIDLDFRKTVTLDKSQIVSISEAQFTTDTNGNNINVKADALTMKDSLIGGVVKGDGRRGVTTLDVRGAISLERSHIGGLKEPIGPVVYHELVTDGTIGQSDNLGIGAGFGTTMMVYIPSRLGQIKGDNLYHSFKALDLSSDQVAILDIPEEVNNVFIRISSGEASLLNGVIESNKKGRNITLINEQGFELGPDTGFDTFSGIRLGAVDAIAFKDGSTFGGTGAIEGQLSDGEAIYEMAPERLTGSIKLFGASLKDYVPYDIDTYAGQSGISLYGNVVDMTTSVVTTIGGADINLQSNALSMKQWSKLEAISPTGGEGGDINVGADELILNDSGFSTISIGGQGGDVNLDVNSMNTVNGKIQASNYYNVRDKYQTGDINITATDSFINERLHLQVTSYTPGGAGNLNINAGTFIGDGTDWTASTELWIIAYQGKTGEIKINADIFDAKQVRIWNVAQSDSALKLDESEKTGYGDITINARDINLEKFLSQTGTKKTTEPTTIGDLKINAENEIIIGQVRIGPWGSRSGMGGDLDFTAKNILSRQDPSKMDPLYYPFIEISGRVSFQAEENLDLDVMNFASHNSNPSRERVNEFKAKNITLGMEPGDQSVNRDTVMFNYPDNTKMNHRTIISATGDVRFLPGVNMTVPALSLSAKNFDVNNSQITVGGTFGSELAVQDTLSLRGGSYIESLSPKGKSNSTVLDPVSIDISSQQLVLEPDSYIVATNHGGDIVKQQLVLEPDWNKPIANLNIQSGEISLEDAFISTRSTNAAKAGDLNIAAAGIVLDKDSRIGSYSLSRGESGDITIGTSRFTMSGGAAVESGLNQSILNGEHDPYASGNSGDIQIASEILNLEGGSYIRNAQIDMALSGDVSITSDEIKIAGRSFISTESIPLYQSDFSNRTEVDQNGSVSIKTKSLDLSESSYVKTTTVIPKRNAGDIIIEADAVSLSGRSSMLSNTEPNKFETELGLTGLDYGNAGRLEIKTGSLQLADQSKISSDSFTSGDGGDVSLTATELAMANRSAIYAGALGQGEGGRITIDTAAMNLSGKSAVVADVRDSGNGGEVSVKADALEMNESLIYGSTSGEGAGSRIIVNAASITLKNGARIESAASAGGAAGELVVQSGIVTITGTGEGFDPKDIEGGETGERVASGLLTSTEGSGDAGTIELKADQLDMQQGLIGSASTGEGAAGSVGLHLVRGLSLGQGASVSVSSSQADGGDIEIESADEVRLARSELTASAAKDGGSIRLLGAGHTYIRDSRLSAEAGQDGGNITISKPELLFMNRGQLSANAVHGHGGYIQVAANTYLPSIDSLITASSEYGAQGVVEMDTVETDIGSGLVVLPDQLNSRSVNLAERCALRLQGDVSSFFINGQGGLPVWSKENYLLDLYDWRVDDR